MELLTDDRVPVGEVELRERAVPDLFFGVLLTAAGLSAGALPALVPDLRSPFALLPLVIIGGSLLLMGYVGLASWSASRRTESWLVRRVPEAVYLRFRSPRNWRFDPAAPSVVRLEAGEIDWVRPLIRALRDRDGDGGWTSTLRASHLEIALAGAASLGPFREALREEGERRDRRGARANHQPLTISPGGTLLLETSRPERIAALFSDVARVRERLDVEARAFDRMSRDERFAHADELERSGRTISAAVARRQAGGVSLEAAHRGRPG